MNKTKIFNLLDKWVSDKGDGNYIEYEYNPYHCIFSNNMTIGLLI